MSDTPATGEGGDKHKAPSELLLQQKIILLQRQHQLQSVSNSLSFPKPVRRVVFWTRPKQRQRWGDDDVLPHINWGDLFFDLFYVAAAYNLSYVLYYSPSAEGFLYFIGTFGPILLEWFQRTSFDARFLWGDDPFHRGFELVHLCALSLAVVHIRPVSAMSDPTRPEMFEFTLGIMCLAVLNMYRSLEVVFAVDGEEAAKLGEQKWLVGFFTQLAFYLAASVKSGIAYLGSKGEDEYDDYGHRGLESLTNACSRILNNLDSERNLAEVTAEKDHVPIILCLCGWSISVILVVIRTYLFEKKNGEHKKFNVPMNIEYIIHRFGELVMLLLGESILSILIVESTNSVRYHVTFFAGIVSIVLLQFCHYKYQPHSPNTHAFRRSIRGGSIYYVLIMIYAHALVAVGTSYKMFLSQYAYEDNLKNKRMRHLVTTLLSRNLAGAADEMKFSTVELKQAVANMFCISMVAVWVCLEGMWITHNGTTKYFAYLKTRHGFCLGMLRLLLIVLMGSISSYTIEPERVTLVGLGLICAEIATGAFMSYFWSKQFEDEDEHTHGDHWPNVTEPESLPKSKESVDEDDDMT